MAEDAARLPELLGAQVLGEILAALRRHTGVDFSAYRRGTVERRIANRMVTLGITSGARYLEVLRACPPEAEQLLDRLAIKVSRFYRNPAVFERLRREVIPTLRPGSAEAPLRVWSAGCANGEEAYTLAMLLDEAGRPALVEATDIDEAALARAALGRFPPAAAEALPDELAARYLSPAPAPDGERPALQVCERLRSRVRFTRHDLLFAAPPGWRRGFDLVSCRNVLIYFTQEGRDEAFASLRAALAPGAVLLLGEAEWPAEDELRCLRVLARAERIFRALEDHGPGT